MAIKFKDVLLRSHREDIEPRSGQVAVCECGAEVFHIFVVAGQEHLHLQCVECGLAFCPEGKCEAEGA